MSSHDRKWNSDYIRHFLILIHILNFYLSNYRMIYDKEMARFWMGYVYLFPYKLVSGLSISAIKNWFYFIRNSFLICLNSSYICRIARYQSGVLFPPQKKFLETLFILGGNFPTIFIFYHLITFFFPLLFKSKIDIK